MTYSPIREALALMRSALLSGEPYDTLIDDAYLAALDALAAAETIPLTERIADDNGDELEHGQPDFPGQGPDEAGGLDACVSCGRPVLEMVPLIEHAAGCTARPAETNPTAIVAEIDRLEGLLSALYRRRDKR